MKLLILLLVLMPIKAFGSANSWGNKCYLFNSVSFGATTTSAIALNPNDSTNGGTVKCLIIQNKDASTEIYVKMKTQHSSTEGLKIAAGDSYELFVTSGTPIYIKSGTGTVTTAILLGTDAYQ